MLPYGIAGAGTLEYRARPTRLETVPAEAAAGIGAGSFSQFVGVLGAGAAVPLAWRGSLLSFELAAHVGRTPARASDAELAARAAGESGTPANRLVVPVPPASPPGGSERETFSAPESGDGSPHAHR